MESFVTIQTGKRLFVLLGLFLFPILTGVFSDCQASTWQVTADGIGDAPTIESAIIQATDGDTVLVGPGRYHEDFSYLGKNLVVKSLLGPGSTILDGSQEDSSIVYFNNGETNEAILEGFTLTGGKGTSSGGPQRDGGAILARDGSPIIQYNVIISNNASWGGGVFVGDEGGLDLEVPPSPIIRGNLFVGNDAYWGGGGLRIYTSTTIVEGNTFRGNRVERGDGGGLKSSILRGSVTIRNNRFFDNDAGDKGGGLEVYGNQSFAPTRYYIEDNLFVRNVARGAGTGDSGAGGAMCLEETVGTVRSNTVYSNRGFGESPCGAGGVKFRGTHTDLLFTMNIIVMNESCGLACWSAVDATFGPNLLWSNELGDLGSGVRVCPEAWMDEAIVADPLFCNAESDDFRLATGTPAIHDGVLMGALPGEACDQQVTTHPTSWGTLKRRFLGAIEGQASNGRVRN